jgi:hypothetical protein
VLTADVPDGVVPSDNVEVSVHPAGAATPATATIKVVAAAVSGVTPDPVPWRVDVPLVITGSGYGP